MTVPDRPLRGRLSGALAFPVPLALCFVLPPLLLHDDPYRVSLLVSIALFSIPALGAWMLMNCGLLSFGQGVFATIGAYATALLLSHAHVSFWLALPASGAIAAILGAALSVPFLRTREVAFSVLTLLSVLALQQVIILTPDVSGGGAGLFVDPLPSIDLGGQVIDFRSSPLAGYYLVLVLLAASLLVVRRVQRSQVFSVMRAISQDETLASSLGVDARRYRAWVFTIAAGMSGLAGAFSSSYFQSAHPDVWGLFPSIFIITYAIIGGRSSIWGPIVGTALIVVISAYLPQADGLQPIFVGVGLMIVVLVLPQGLMGLPAVLGRWATDGRAYRGRRGTGADDPGIARSEGRDHGADASHDDAAPESLSGRGG